jgi:hypothetical protein
MIYFLFLIQNSLRSNSSDQQESCFKYSNIPPENVSYFSKASKNFSLIFSTSVLNGKNQIFHFLRGPDPPIRPNRQAKPAHSMRPTWQRLRLLSPTPVTACLARASLPPRGSRRPRHANGRPDRRTAPQHAASTGVSLALPTTPRRSRLPPLAFILNWPKSPWRDARRGIFSPDRHSPPPVPAPLGRPPNPVLLGCLPTELPPSIGARAARHRALRAQGGFKFFPSSLFAGGPTTTWASSRFPSPTSLLSAPPPSGAILVSTAAANPSVPCFFSVHGGNFAHRLPLFLRRPRSSAAARRSLQGRLPLLSTTGPPSESFRAAVKSSFR